jgi:prepilin-type N-terminal cleavage/methylation domain-containing protein
MNLRQKGFTIVELLIVIIVIAILAAISLVAYTGLQQRARDSQRKSDIAAITKALELYYNDHGKYPGTPGQTGGSTTINSGWSTTADSSWGSFVSALEPYAKGISKDPISTPGARITSGEGYNYAYFASESAYCGAAPYQMYVLVYQYENAPRESLGSGSCGSPALHYSAASMYRMVK